MNQGYSSYSAAAPGYAVANADRRSRFLVRTYNHLFGAIAAFTVLEVVLFKAGVADIFARALLGSRWGWLGILGLFMVVSWVATHYAQSSASLGLQYFGLAAYVAAEAVVFMPLLWIANTYVPGAIQSAGIITILGFAALTAVVFVTRKDFSFLRGVLLWGGIGVMLLIVGSIIFGFELGMFFSVGMIVFAGAAILYDTSNVLLHYPEDRYVGAALQLFASVALLFWYVLRFVMQLSSSRN